MRSIILASPSRRPRILLLGAFLVTLIVSLRNLDGIVIAGDSLSTMVGNLEVQADVNVVCPQCGHQHVTQTVVGGIPLPSTTFSFAQKVFPFLDEYGVGTFGAGQLAGKTIYFAIRELEKQLEKLPMGQRPKNVTEAAQKIGDYMQGLLKQQVQHEGADLSSMADGWRPLGLQVVGYDKDVAKTVVVHLGKDVAITAYVNPGITASGESEVLQALGTIYQGKPEAKPVYEAFSLQDAIAYAEFAIRTTASFQQFSRTIPSVGGEIDVALVTPFDHFRWIKQKTLQSKLTGD